MPSISLAEIIAELSELDDRNDRLEYLIEIGKTLPRLPDELKVEENRVLGCQARVWVVAQRRAGSPPVLDFSAESDAMIVQGLIAVLLAAFSGRTATEILAFPIDELFNRLKLPALVPMRSSGLYAMVQRIRRLTEETQSAEPADATSDRLVLMPFKPQAPAKETNPELSADRHPLPSAAAELKLTAASLSSPEISSPLDVNAIRRDFPILETILAEGYPLAYLDNGASTQRPRQVIASMVEAYEHYYSNVHRGGHTLAAESTVRYEAAREAVRELINARSATEVVFCSGTTAAINLVARSYGDANLRPGDEIVLTEMEHHSNIVPWQQAAERTGAVIRWAPITDGYELDMPAFQRLLNERTKIVAITAMSNVLGTINPIEQIVKLAHAAGAVVLVDAAQSVPHEPTDVRALDVDFLALSGHKMLGPSGVGVLYGREKLLDAMPPFIGGGSMIKSVTKEGFTPADLPYKFEAGTPMIVAAIGLGKAVHYLQEIGLAKVRQHDLALTRLAHELLGEIPGLRIIGPAPEKKGGLVSFVFDNVHPDDISKFLDLQGIAIRAGHHCAMPLHARLGISASSRASFYLYNTAAEVERLAAALRDARRVFQR